MQRLLRVLAVIGLAGLGAVRADELAARVVLVANSDAPGSVEIARHYAAARGVPLENIIARPMPTTETITWSEFVDTIWTPLQQELLRQKWLDGIAMKLTDGAGRTKVAMSGHRISYLVVCRGVPLRIAHDPARSAPALPFTNKEIFRTNAGAVDSELSLLANPNYAINAFMPNPLYRSDAPSRYETAQVVKVARLDAPGLDEAMTLVDRAIAAERAGVSGRAYVDIGGNAPDGDRSLEAAATQLREAGFDLDVDRAPATLAPTARFDAPVLYFGWYAGAVNGPFTLPGFRFPPGAIALHIHSYSAQTLRSAEANWCGPLLARGVTATFGNVFEPYLQFTHQPHLLVRALLRGENLGDAACYAQPVLSWQTVVIGDPLYRPFPADRRDTELQATGAGGYDTVRRMLALEAARRKGEAVALARQAQREHPSFAVGLALAQRLRATGDQPGAAAALAFVPLLDAYRTDEWALAREAAQVLAEGGRTAEALAVWRNLLRVPALPGELRRAWLPAAIDLARRADEPRQAEAWQTMLREVAAHSATAAEAVLPSNPDVRARQKR